MLVLLWSNLCVYSFQVFMANEKLDNKVMQHLIFMQVCSSNTTEHIHILCLLFPHTTPPNSPYISSHTSCYLHWEKQVVDQTFHKNLISSYIPLTLAHTLPVIFTGRNKLLIKTFMWTSSRFNTYNGSLCVLTVQSQEFKKNLFHWSDSSLYWQTWNRIAIVIFTSLVLFLCCYHNFVVLFWYILQNSSLMKLACLKILMLYCIFLSLLYYLSCLFLYC